MDATRCHAAYCSAAFLALDALQDAHARFQLLAPGADAPLLAAWTHVHDAVGTALDLQADFRAAADAEDAPNTQSRVARWLDDQDGARLLDLVAADRDRVPALQHQARVRSCASVPGSAWLTALPRFYSGVLTDETFKSAARWRLGLSILPVSQTCARCQCGKDLTPYHMMGCPKLTEDIRARHDFLAHAWRRILQRAGIASSVEPLLHLLSKPGASMRQADARGDVLAILRAVTALDVSVAHPAVAGNDSSADWLLRQCAEVAGFAAQQRDEQKRKKYRRNNFAEQFTPLSHETYGRLGLPAMALLSQLGDIVEAGGRSSKGSFMQSALLELSVALQRGKKVVFRMYNFNFAKLSGHHFVHGDVIPTALLD